MSIFNEEQECNIKQFVEENIVTETEDLLIEKFIKEIQNRNYYKQ